MVKRAKIVKRLVWLGLFLSVALFIFVLPKNLITLAFAYLVFIVMGVLGVKRF